MNLAGAVQRTILVGLLCVMGAVPLRSGAAEEVALDFVSLKFEGACDDKNNRLWITSTHTYKTIAVTVRWRAAGGKDLVDQFFSTPNSVREIGCAAEANITLAAFADF